MPKYVCDFEQVYSIGESLCNVSNDIHSSVTSYSSNISSDLSSWEGVAKDSFVLTNDSHIENVEKDLKYINEFGEFIKKASKDIESLETELASLKI